MKNKPFKFTIFLTTLLLAASLTTQAAVTPFNIPKETSGPNASQVKPYVPPTPPNLDATGYVLMDAYSGKILAAKNPDMRLAPASLTKMMTSYIVSAALDAKRVHLNDLVPISEQAWRTGGSKMFVKVGDRVPLQQLMQGMIVASGNDACVALAEFIAGSQDSFVNLMNQQAALLGMKNTNFKDVNGLPDPGHYTTPRDMAILGRALTQDFPEDYQWYSQKWFLFNNIKQPNRNRLLWSDPSVDGIKTGHTDDAGFCLVASAKRNGTRLVSVVMGAPSDNARANESAQLLTWGFRFFASHKVYSANARLGRTRVWYGEIPEIPVGPEKDVYVTLPIGQDAAVKTSVSLKHPIMAPINKGQVLGSLRLMMNDASISEQPLIALQDDPEGGLMRKVTDYIYMQFNRIFKF